MKPARHHKRRRPRHHALQYQKDLLENPFIDEAYGGYTLDNTAYLVPGVGFRPVVRPSPPTSSSSSSSSNTPEVPTMGSIIATRPNIMKDINANILQTQEKLKQDFEEKEKETYQQDKDKGSEHKDKDKPYQQPVDTLTGEPVHGAPEEATGAESYYEENDEDDSEKEDYESFKEAQHNQLKNNTRDNTTFTASSVYDDMNKNLLSVSTAANVYGPAGASYTLPGL